MAGKSKSGGVTYRTKAKQHFFRSLDLNDVITPADDDQGAFTGTKLVCSLGPSSHTVPVLEAMLNAGMVAARIDLTWGGLDFHRKSLQALNEAMTNTKKLCAITLDTLGREMMVRRPCVFGEDGWPLHPDPVEVQAGQIVMLTTRQDVEAHDNVFPVTYPHLHMMVEPGDTIYIGRYLVSGSDSASLYLEVLETDDQDIKCQAQNSATMDGLMTVFHMERSNDSLLNLQNNLPLLSDYDQEAIKALGAEFEIDFVNLAFTRTREDVQEARTFLDSIGLTGCRVLAKIETRQSLLNFRGILSLADGVIVSRGNIGLDVAPEKMALVQKQLISNCNLLGKPVLITRVVDSMVTNPRPTRAEATDIANAVLDGTDGILLGAETLRGAYPVEAVSTIAQICRVAESVYDHASHYDHLMQAAQEMEFVVQSAAQQAAAAAPQQPHALAPGGTGTTTGHKVAFAPGSGSDGDAEDMSSGGASPLSSTADMQGMGGRRLHATKSKGSFSNLQGLIQSSSYASLQAAYQQVHAFTAYGGAGSKSVAISLDTYRGNSGPGIGGRGFSSDQLPFLSKLESLASSAVRAAGKVEADLIVVYTATGRTAQLVAKYRPPMPILTLVVPRLVNDGIRWKLEGLSTARSCQLTRGLLPMLATPGPNGDAVLETAVVKAALAGLVAPRHHVVVLQQIHNDLCVKIMTLDASGRRVAGPRNHPRPGIGSATGRKAGALYPRSPAANRLHQQFKTDGTGELVESDGDEDDDFYDGDELPLLAAIGDLQASASVVYDNDFAKALTTAFKSPQSPLRQWR